MDGVKDLSSLLMRVTRGRAEITFPDLFHVFEIPCEVPVLEKLVRTKERLRVLGLSVVPGFDDGELYTQRCIDFATKTVSSDVALVEIGGSESTKLEFKSSLFYDHQKAKFNSQLSAVNLRSEAVIQSALKTVAAFLNTDGGVLYVGVKDDGGLVGLEYDFDCINAKAPTENDDWQLAFRDLIKSRFKDGEIIGQYLDPHFVQLRSKWLARIEVTSRARLSFLRVKDNWSLFRRDGNRTLKVTIDQVQEFLEWRAKASS